MKILLTGKNGYIGKSLLNFLKNKYDVIAISRTELNLIDKKAVDAWFKNKYFDVVIHTAIAGGSPLEKDPEYIAFENIQMFLNLFNNRQNFNKFLNLGSGAELYFKHTPYGFSKDIIRTFINKIDNFYNIRIFNVFDENEKNTRFIKTCLSNYIKQSQIIINQNKLMDFFYMKDFESLIDYYINNNFLKEIDCSYKEKYSLLDIAEFINNLQNYKIPIIINNKLYSHPYTGDSKLPIQTLGLKTGIINSYRNLLNVDI